MADTAESAPHDGQRVVIQRSQGIANKFAGRSGTLHSNPRWPANSDYPWKVAIDFRPGIERTHWDISVKPCEVVAIGEG